MTADQNTYWTRSLEPLPMLCTLLPLILYLEITLAVVGADLWAERIAARVQIRSMLEFLGLSPVIVLHGTGLLIVVVLLTWHGMTGARWRIRPLDPARSLLEGVVACTPLLATAFFLGSLGGMPLAIAQTAHGSPGVDALAIAVGAGLTEELLFRMVGIAACHWVLVDLARLPHTTGLLLGVLLTTVAFVLYHHPAEMATSDVVFVGMSGLYLGGLYVFRGFAIAVIAHTAYDLIVLLN